MSEYLSKHEKRLLKHQQKEEKSTEIKSPPLIQNKKRFFLFVAIFIVLIGGVAALLVSSKNKPGNYDDFAKCLTEKGAVMYGAIEWCQYTRKQAGMFGNSFKYVTYKDYKEGPSEIKITPTWYINSQKYEGVQSFDTLAKSTGCQY